MPYSTMMVPGSIGVHFHAMCILVNIFVKRL